jgi:hypothetical protein
MASDRFDPLVAREHALGMVDQVVELRWQARGELLGSVGLLDAAADELDDTPVDLDGFYADSMFNHRL